MVFPVPGYPLIHNRHVSVWEYQSRYCGCDSIQRQVPSTRPGSEDLYSAASDTFWARIATQVLSTSFNADDLFQFALTYRRRELRTVGQRTRSHLTRRIRPWLDGFFFLFSSLSFSYIGHHDINLPQNLIIPLVCLALETTHLHVVGIDGLCWLSGSDRR